MKINELMYENKMRITICFYMYCIFYLSLILLNGTSAHMTFARLSQLNCYYGKNSQTEIQ